MGCEGEQDSASGPGTRQLSMPPGRKTEEGEQAGPGGCTGAAPNPWRLPSSWSLSISSGLPSGRTYPACEPPLAALVQPKAPQAQVA